MILEIGFNNFRMFKKEHVISFKGDLRSKYLTSNITNIKNGNVLKSIALYGANNSGKSNIVSLLDIIKQFLLGNTDIVTNRDLFKDEKIFSAYIIFINDINDGNWMKYDFSFDSENHSFIKESLTKITFYEHGKPLESAIFNKDINNHCLFINNKDKSELLNILPNDKPFLYTISFNGDLSNLSFYKDQLKQCGENIIILKMFNIPFQKTLEMLKENDPNKTNFIKSFVKSSDISIDDFSYGSNKDIVLTNNKIDEESLKVYQDNIDAYKLITTYNNVKVPSMLFDSSGTKKIEAIASYIYDCIKNGKLLVVDELDNGLHFSLTRAIVNMFNNMANNQGQILFTSHDLLLIDCPYLLRKDQIYFLYRDSKDNNDSEILSLKSLTTDKSGLREGDNLLKRYNHGDFGHIPMPDFTKELLDCLKI